MKTWVLLLLGPFGATAWGGIIIPFWHATDNAFVSGLLLLAWFAGVLAIYEAIDRAVTSEEDVRLGSLRSDIERWQRLKKIFQEAPKPDRPGGMKMARPVIITELSHADRDYFKDDDAEPEYRRPFSQHPDAEEVERFQSVENPLAYLASTLTRQPDERLEELRLQTVEARPAAKRVAPRRRRIVTSLTN